MGSASLHDNHGSGEARAVEKRHPERRGESFDLGIGPILTRGVGSMAQPERFEIGNGKRGLLMESRCG